MSKNAKTKAPAKKNAKPADAPAASEPTKLDAKHGIAVVKAVEKGVAVATKTFGAEVLTHHLGQAIAKINPKLKVTETGIIAAKGYQPDELELTEIVGGLLRTNDETTKFKTSLQWVIGDAAILTDSLADGGSDRVVAQAISERGMAKHTVMQAIAVARDFAPEDRIGGVSFTHHQELRNYRSSIKNKKGLAKLVEELREQAKADEVMSCAELRQRLRILAGKVDDEKPEKEKKAKADGVDSDEHEFFYIDEDLNFYRSTGLDRSMLGKDGVVIIDATDKTMLNPKGALHCSARDLPKTVEAQVTEAPAEEEKPEPPKADKPKRDAKDSKPKGKASIPD